MLRFCANASATSILVTANFVRRTTSGLFNHFIRQFDQFMVLTNQQKTWLITKLD